MTARLLALCLALLVAAGACASDDDEADGAVVSVSTTLLGSAPAPVGDPLEWTRADFDDVSAYVLVRDDHVLVVDAGPSESTVRIEAALARLDRTLADVTAVVVTHDHDDHTGAVAALAAAAPDATVHVAPGVVLEGVTVAEVADGATIGGVEVVLTPGHTPAHLSLYDAATRLVVAGDALRTEDGRPRVPEEADSLDEAFRSIRRLAQRPVDVLLVGHGEPLTVDADAKLKAMAADL